MKRELIYNKTIKVLFFKKDKTESHFVATYKYKTKERKSQRREA